MLKVETFWAIKSRHEIPLRLNELGLTGWGAEIGVEYGVYSDFILSNSNLSRLISIDPWYETPYRYLQCVELLSQHGPRSHIWRMSSEEAADYVEDESLDFVYIDARHVYESVKKDIQLWWPKVKRDGLFCGHDYTSFFPGVVQAVDEFVHSNQLRLYVTKVDFVWDDHEIRSWIIPK